jgi:hypothetical protein
MTWHVLTDGRKFWGHDEENCGTMTGLQDAILCYGPGAIGNETRRAWEVMRVEVKPVPVKFVKTEKETRLEVVA